MNIRAIELKAESMRQRLGGTIFSFPIEEDNPFSKYAVTVFTGEGFKTYPDPLTIAEAAAGILETLKGFKSIGVDDNYERNVRFTSYEAQMNAPDITMRRLKKDQTKWEEAKTRLDEDFQDNGDGYDISARGLIKLSYWMFKDDGNAKAKLFMDEYYKLLSSRKYGKTPAAIKQEVRRKDKTEFVNWVDRTYERYVRTGQEIFEIMNRIKETKNQ